MYQLPRPSKATPKGSINRAVRAGVPRDPSPQPATHSIFTVGLITDKPTVLKTMVESAIGINFMNSAMVVLHR
jgi:hypothetical protein